MISLSPMHLSPMKMNGSTSRVWAVHIIVNCSQNNFAWFEYSCKNRKLLMDSIHRSISFIRILRNDVTRPLSHNHLNNENASGLCRRFVEMSAKKAATNVRRIEGGDCDGSFNAR